jgi:hypothetical protein
MGNTLDVGTCFFFNRLTSTGSNSHHHFGDISDYGPTFGPFGFVDFGFEIRDSVECILAGSFGNDSIRKSIDFLADLFCTWPIMCFPNAGEGLSSSDRMEEQRSPRLLVFSEVSSRTSGRDHRVAA